MRILVCVKAILLNDDGLVLNDTYGKKEAAFQTACKLNEWDACALEAALALKDEGFASRIDVVSAGTSKIDYVIRRAMGMGADNGIHIVHDENENHDSMTVARQIAELAKNRDYSLIFCGAMSEDGMEAAVGPMIAALLDWPFAASVLDLKIMRDIESARVTCEMEGGLRQLFRLELPALVTVQTGVTPRYPKLSAMLRANRAVIETCLPDFPGSWKPKQRVTGYRIPDAVRKTVFLSGSMPEKAARLISIMREKGVIA